VISSEMSSTSGRFSGRFSSFSASISGSDCTKKGGLGLGFEMEDT
jgi:hypothetical protein